jgi:orotate phosphoribosyltransferase
VPVGGLLLATAYSLETNTPLVYSRLKPEGTGARGVEGRYAPGSRVLLIDDLVTGGGGLIEIAQFLAEHDLQVRDAVVLIDRGHAAAEALRQQGISFISILKLDVMMMHYLSSGLIGEEQYQAYQRYIREASAARSANQRPPADEPPSGDANDAG